MIKEELIALGYSEVESTAIMINAIDYDIIDYEPKEMAEIYEDSIATVLKIGYSRSMIIDTIILDAWNLGRASYGKFYDEIEEVSNQLFD